MGKRLIPQRRGSGSDHMRSPSHRHVDDIRIPHYAQAEGTIKDLIQAPGRTSPLAVVDFGGKKSYQLAVEGTKVGQKIYIGTKDADVGNILALGNIPEGTLVHNVEGQPLDGGKFVKTAGTSALVVSRGKTVVLTMPSGELKEFDPNCRAVVGVVAGGGRTDKPLAKAGKNYLTLRSRSVANKKTSGVAMNAVDHPNGGGSHPHVGGPNCHGRTAPPGQKAGFIAPKKKIKRK
ncbi:MAG: 50S ribosomal protein L2 [Candidatus Methanomethylophilus sp.]|jgi:large subunit ribosomal protein L2|nr:50S ribosomal protein L2 [Methanomethylophilus sp.]TQS83143.1 MAG: 50S ribosomal protein L2 [Methanomethylophilus alvi]WII08887.1 50S ribosomal protein L2 [Methanomassiliicoccales archaeon LGM-DZ1]MCI2075419.1 50S ribosomal protein L2 [Methanomethylophilus sp.]MCI2093241.1 50S ribosomal protein L2 [Methanomethylophilus sp.]